jgi:hypothetical protein
VAVCHADLRCASALRLEVPRHERVALASPRFDLANDVDEIDHEARRASRADEHGLAPACHDSTSPLGVSSDA